MPTPNDIESESPSDLPLARSSGASILLGLAKTGGRGLTHATVTVVISESVSFFGSYALYGLLTTVFAGEPTIAASVARDLAKYQVPAVAIPVALVAALHQVEFGSKVPYRVISAATNGLGMTSFSIPMIMQLVTRIVQIVKKESRNTPVWITDSEALGVIGGCSVVGLAQALQTYFQLYNADVSARNEHAVVPAINVENKSFLNRLSTNQTMIVLFAMMNSASAFHAGAFQLTKLLGYDTSGLVEYYTRVGITLTAGLAGGIILGRANPEKRVDAKLFNLLQNLIKLSTLGIGIASLFYLSPNAEVIFGKDVIDEQTWLWLAVIPSETGIILMLQMIVFMINLCRQHKSEEEEPLLITDSSINSESPLRALSLFNNSENLEKITVVSEEEEEEAELAYQSK
ncbi:MAG: hypothetical protein Q8M03_14620 [Legionella sp.]|nr:hypothetical protein [Legionella sp.]